MAFQLSDQDWQLAKKTILERNAHMFNNPLMSDIKLTCGESKRKYFYAHKYVLATSSPVFYAMFYGDLAEKNTVVHLEDADEKSLEEFLRFLYTDECTLTPEITAVKVLYLAKKYIIPSLRDKCFKAVHDTMNPASVFTVLEQAAIYFDEKELEEKCWEMIDDEASEAITSDDFIGVNQNTLINLLKRETLKIEEMELFQAVLKWSESECLNKGLEVTGINRRAVLGDAIYQIRFLSMSQKEFTQYVASQSGLLTAEEIISILQAYNRIDIHYSKWKLVQRQSKILRCKRFPSVLFPDELSWVSDEWLYNFSHTLSFNVNKPCTFHGVCLFGQPHGIKYTITLEVGNAKVRGIFTSELKYKSPDIFGYDVMLSTPISVNENEVVTMVATIKGPAWYNGEGGQASVEVGGAIVTFTNSSGSSKFTTVEEGQFYEIILSF